MSRKHDKFTYSYGWKTAPEQWYFQWNNKPINLDYSTRTSIANLMIQGRKTEAMDILKRLLRKQEKETGYICIGFMGEKNNQFYFTQQLKCKSDNLMDKLYAYKEWKRYILSKNCTVSMYNQTQGYLKPDGSFEKYKEEEILEKIDINRPCTIRLHTPKAFSF